MKKIKLFALGLIGASMMMTSCTDDTEDPDAPKPNLSVTAFTANQTGTVNEGFEVGTGTTIMFAINAAKVGGTDLQDFSVTVGGANSISTLNPTTEGYEYGAGAESLKNADDEVYIDTLTIDGVFLSNEGTNNFQFVVTDKDGQSTTVDIAMEIKDATPLANEVTGAFFHIGGSAQGAYDLVAGAPVAGTGGSADPTVQDMKNTDQAGDAFTGSWTAGNATTFVKADGSFDYDNATEDAAMDAYNNGTATANVNDPATGDIYIAKVRGGSDYMVIKITDVDPTDNTCQCGNTGKMSFDFKKK